MDEHGYLTSLKNKEFLILEKLCNNSISQADKEEFEKELKETRLEIEKLRWASLTEIRYHTYLKKGKLHLSTPYLDKVTKSSLISKSAVN